MGVGAAHFSRLRVCPPHEAHFVVEEQIAVGGALGNEQGDVVVAVGGEQLLKVCVAQDVDIVDEDGGGWGEEVLCLLKSSAGVKELGALV